MSGESEDEYPGQRLHQYAIFDREDSMYDILSGEERKNINAPDRCGRTPVYTAVSNNSIRCLEILLQHGANPSIPGGERVRGMTPLHHALLEGKKEAIRLLLDYGADLNVVDESGLSPLSLAKNIGNREFTDIFQKEADKRYNNALTVVSDLCRACEEGNLEKVRENLELPTPVGLELACMLDPDDPTKTKTPLVVAARAGDPEIMSELLNSVDKYSPSPSVIHAAVEEGHLCIVKQLLKKFPECCNELDDLNQSPLHMACSEGDLDIVRCLLEWDYPDHMVQPVYDEDEGVEYRSAVLHLNQPSGDKKTALYFACEKGHEDVVDFLLNFKVKGKKTMKSSANRLSSEMFKDQESVLSSQSPDGTSDKSSCPTEIFIDFKPIRVLYNVSHNVSCIFAAVKNGHSGIIDILARTGALKNLTHVENGTEFSVLLHTALSNSDMLMVDKLLHYNMEDLNNRVLQEAICTEKTTFIPVFLKYKSSPDNQNCINKAVMKKEYEDFSSVSSERIVDLTASDPRYIEVFPTQSVNIRWQNLKTLYLEESWLTYPVILHNKAMTSINKKMPLFAITRLDISGNQLAILPPVLFELPSLCVLIASNNKIKEIPENRHYPVNSLALEDISIQKNMLTALPHFIFALPNLRFLNASHNKISLLPSSMWQTSCLKTLDLSNNELTVLPEPVWVNSNQGQGSVADPDMVKLEDSTSSSLSDGPDSTLTNFQRANYWSRSGTLVISHDKIKADEDQQRGLKTLKLEKNKFAKFPPFLSCCVPNLEHLELAGNKLKQLGNLAEYPRFLKLLDLSHNELVTMDDWKEKETEIICFCQYRRSACPHRCHWRFETLESLNLSHNRLTELVLLRSPEAMTQLCESMTNTYLSQLEVAERNVQVSLLFPWLSILNIDKNEFKELPDNIGELTKLNTLTLNSNRNLHELPPSLGLLEKLRRIEVELCPLQGPICDVIKGSQNRAEEITGFLRSILEESEKYNCMNLMIVGSVNIGKTSLLEHLSKKGVNKPQRTHFNERQDKNAKGVTKDGKPLSTVGIDISKLVLDGDKGKVEFRTWDFAGQKEYYATHQYFLSPRSLFLVVWNLTTGYQGVDDLRQWLVNIQAQAHGAPVIIVGTHLDEIRNKKLFSKDWEESMNKLIADRYLSKVDFDSLGLPRILCSMNVAAGRSASNIEKLKNTIYETVFTLNHPDRKKEKLLGHKVPKKYIMLQTCISNIVKERKESGREPVLDSSSYLVMVMDEMQNMQQTSVFRNKNDLHQATRFLHENGVLCHFEDTPLRDQYFLEPQWLCDQLAKVVSIQEVQKFSSEGVMKVHNMKQIYVGCDKISKYILSLLNKFEVALQFDEEHLLLPTLLPTADMVDPQKMKEIPVKRKGVDLSRRSVGTFSQSLIDQTVPTYSQEEVYIHSVKAEKNPMFSNTRLYLLTYFPSGFWPRLITRILADESFYEPALRLFAFPPELMEKSLTVQNAVPVWRCWQTGLELVYFGNVIMQVKEVRTGSEYSKGMCDYSLEGLDMLCFFDDRWGRLDIAGSSVLEISFQADHIFVNYSYLETGSFQSVQQIDIQHDDKAKTAIFAKFVDHIDSLLQDWFPDIGEGRFLQSCEGRYLITRVIPCPLCLQAEIDRQTSDKGAWEYCSPTGVDSQPISISMEKGVSNSSDATQNQQEEEARVICSFLVEKCIKNVLDGVDEICKVHKAVSPVYMPMADGVTRTMYVVPDAVFLDLDDSNFVVKDDMLIVGEKLGRGAFGTVSAGKLRRGDLTVLDVAVKVLYDPKKRAEMRKQSAHMSLETICAAYTTARQEVTILQTVEHPHIVPLVGLSRRPLALLLSLAPLGALSSILETRVKDGLRLPVWIIKQIIVQTADALVYLHNRSIIYRDLKSDNILVWKLPGPTEMDPRLPVLVKLADYGISRSVVPAGAKGYGGTPPFIAPEILVHAGRDTYTEKVDIFSFGMFMFELLTCRLPLAEINNPSVHVCHGGRPTLTSEEAIYPSHLLDLMTVCWDQDPLNRPSAAHICMIANSPQFCHLSDTVTMLTNAVVLSACSLYLDETVSGELTQVWVVSQHANKSFVEVLVYNKSNKCVSNKSLALEYQILAVCNTLDSVWCLDSNGTIHIYSSTYEVKANYPLPVGKISRVQSMSYHHGYVCILLKETGQKKMTLICLPEQAIKFEEQPAPIRVGGMCYCATYVKSRDSHRIWIGTSNGEILVQDINTEDSPDHRLSPYKIPSSNQICSFIVTLENIHASNFAWTYNYPGSKVFCWDVVSEQVVSTIDCSTIMPATERQKDRRSQSFKANRYQITALMAVDRYLYISTTWGCLIVADAFSLQTFRVFRCHSDEEFYCKSILPLGSLDNLTHDPVDQANYAGLQNESPGKCFHGTNMASKNFTRGVVTVGRGYVDLISHVTQIDRNAFVRSESMEDAASLMSKTDKLTLPSISNKDHTYVIAWIADQWEHY